MIDGGKPLRNPKLVAALVIAYALFELVPGAGLSKIAAPFLRLEPAGLEGLAFALLNSFSLAYLVGGVALLIRKV